MATVLRRGDSKERMLKIQKEAASKIKKKGVNTKKFCGTIRLKESPLEIQKNFRNEWR